MGLDLWYNSGVKRGTYKSESGYGILSPPRSAQEKPLDKPHRVWYNKCGKKAKSPVARSMGTARGSMVETFTGFQFIK